jgi:sugar lactone lactonase YvrE
MIGIVVRRSAIVVMIAVAASCGYDSSAPEQYTPPPTADVNEGLWISSGSNSAILRLAPGQLLASGRPTASASITTSSATLFSINSIAFDTAGTMWIASAADSLLLAFSPGDLATSGLHVATTVIAPAEQSLSAPLAIAFDRLHRLWVANFHSGTLVRFDPDQLLSDGAPKPAVTIEGLFRPTSLAFDAGGSLWVTNRSASTVVKYSAAQLEASGAPAPDVVLSSIDASIAGPLALAFDGAGNLWVSNLGNPSIVAFGPEQLRATASPAPKIVISPRAGSFGVGLGLAFDARGSLWVVSTEGLLFKFAQASLAATGAPEPTTQVEVNGHSFLSGIAFWPMPQELPIN